MTDQPAGDIIVYKLDERGREVWQYPARLLAYDGTHVRLEAFFNRDDIDLGYTTFKRGDCFIEYFYSDRWYNIFTVYDRDTAALKGWYCNVCRPAQLDEDAVRCDDLALDIWVSPAGDVTVLDEDEFEALGLGDDERAQALAALEALRRMAERRALPI